jgi:hypothetical protein
VNKHIIHIRIHSYCEISPHQYFVRYSYYRITEMRLVAREKKIHISILAECEYGNVVYSHSLIPFEALVVSVGMSVDVRSERWGDAFVYDSGKQVVDLVCKTFGN